MTSTQPGGFKPPEIPPIITKRHIADFVAALVQKYRESKYIVSTEQLTYQQVEEIVDGVRHLVYQLEELKPKKDGK